MANLVLIAVMVAIFGAALLLPFPKGHGAAGLPDADEVPEPHKLLPDRQPAYVASWWP